MRHRFSRRGFLSGLGLASLSGGLGRPVAASEAAATDVYADLGVRPFIQCAGTYTTLSGSLLLPEVCAAMDEASRAYVSLGELQEAAGARIGRARGC